MIYRGRFLVAEAGSIPLHILTKIKQDLTVPVVDVKGQPVMEEYFYEKDGALYLPRFYPVENHGLIVQENRLSKGSPIRLSSSIKLLEHQIPAVEAMSARDNGVLVAPCGAGKTVMGTELIARNGSVALVLMMKEFLMDQWASEVRRFLPGVRIGFIGGSRKLYRNHKVQDNDWQVADVIISTVQSINDFPGLKQLSSRVGYVLGDEIHHGKARTFANSLSLIPAAKVQGVTATPVRSDGLERIYYYFTGAPAYRIEQAVLEDIGHTVRPRIQFVMTGEVWKLPPQHGGWFQSVLGMLTKNQARNSIILNLAATSERKGRYTVILSERVEHCVALCEKYRAAGLDGAVVTGQIGDINEAFTHKTVFATMSLLSEGLNVKRLNTLILATPFSSAGRMEQVVGRVVRAQEGKTGAIVFDLVDAAPALRKMADNRDAAVQAIGWSTSWVEPPQGYKNALR